MQTQIESKKQQVEAAFERLQQELGKQQRLLLARLTELERQIWKERDEYLSKLSEEVARLIVTKDIDVDAEWQKYVDDNAGIWQPVVDDLNEAFCK